VPIWVLFYQPSSVDFRYLIVVAVARLASVDHIENGLPWSLQSAAIWYAFSLASHHLLASSAAAAHAEGCVNCFSYWKDYCIVYNLINVLFS